MCCCSFPTFSPLLLKCTKDFQRQSPHLSYTCSTINSTSLLLSQIRSWWSRHIIGMHISRRPPAVVPLCPNSSSGSTTCHKAFKTSCLNKEHGGYCPDCGKCVPWKEGCRKHKKRKKELLPKPPTNTKKLAAPKHQSIVRRSPNGYMAARFTSDVDDVEELRVRSPYKTGIACHLT